MVARWRFCFSHICSFMVIPRSIIWDHCGHLFDSDTHHVLILIVGSRHAYLLPVPLGADHGCDSRSCCGMFCGQSTMGDPQKPTPPQLKLPPLCWLSSTPAIVLSASFCFGFCGFRHSTTSGVNIYYPLVRESHRSLGTPISPPRIMRAPKSSFAFR